MIFAYALCLLVFSTVSMNVPQLPPQVAEWSTAFPSSPKGMSKGRFSGVIHAGQSAGNKISETGSSIILFMCGDVMTGRGIDQVLPHPSDPTIHEPYLKSAKGYVDIAEKVNGPIH